MSRYRIPSAYGRRACAVQAAKLEAYGDRAMRCANDPRWRYERARLLRDAADYYARARAWRDKEGTA
jgi:hypothetical protein